MANKSCIQAFSDVGCMVVRNHLTCSQYCKQQPSDQPMIGRCSVGLRDSGKLLKCGGVENVWEKTVAHAMAILVLHSYSRQK